MALTAASALATGAFAAGASSAAAAPEGTPTRLAAHHRGQLVSHSHLRSLTARETAAELTGTGFSGALARYGVDTYRLVYRTVDPQGRPTTASGLLVLPHGGARTLRTVVFEHGTTSYRGDAPSKQQHDFATSPELSYGAAGFAAVAPDYLGLGTGPGFHPYMDLPSETTASLDMLRAASDFVRGARTDAGGRSRRTLDREVLVTGFSQGASAALGLAKALDRGADPRFRLGAVAPVSGAYALREVELPALTGGRITAKMGVLYTAYLLVSWNRLHHLYASPSEVFRPPYADSIERLLDGNHTGEQLMAGTPDTLDALLTPRGLNLLRHPDGRLLAALRTADGVCSGWSTHAPVRLFATRSDSEAVAANTDHCAAAFHSAGVPVTVTDLPAAPYQNSTHLGSNVVATAEIVRWFSSLRPAAGAPAS
ncbi:hypothetical protein GCM10010430_30280 [Kitasatospora cystarginea]|uniref:Lipase n=1 Tax=Kitasatospora cystarginea TaxID=58350 RepID=A0ABN3E196_9ACTN